MEQPLSRRAWLGALVSGAGAAAAACGPTGGVTELSTPDGKVLQWEGDDLLVLVSGVQPTYRAGEPIKVNVLVNNQGTGLVQVRVRTRLLARGDQAIAEAEVATLTVESEDAANVDRAVLLAKSLAPGEYTLSVELPPWRVNDREAGRLVTLRTRVQIDPAA